MADMTVSGESAILKSDGTFDIRLGFRYGGQPGDDLTKIELFLEHSSTLTSCQFPNLTSNPANVAINPTGQVLVTRNCDFRSAGAGVKSLDLRLKYDSIPWFPPNDCVGMVQVDCKTVNNVISIENILGGESEQYIENVTPVSVGGGRKFNIFIGGQNGATIGIRNAFPCHAGGSGGAPCFYRFRVVGYELDAAGTYLNWPTQYTCDPIAPQRPASRDMTHAMPSTFECDFSRMPLLNQITLAIYRGTADTLSDVGGAPISTYNLSLSSRKAFIESANPVAGGVPNDFNISVKFSVDSGNNAYSIKVLERGSNTVVFDPPGTDCFYNSNRRDEIISSWCSFSSLDPRGRYDIAVFDSINNKLHSIPIDLPDKDLSGVGTGGSCVCGNANAIPIANACNVLPNGNSCWFGFAPSVTMCSGVDCVCDCIFDAALIPPAGPGGAALPAIDLSLADFQAWAAKGQQYIIAFGIFASIFIVPYFGVLLASGNPESIKEGLEWAKSWAFGLLLLLLSSLVIRIIGSDILGF